ncbi:MAG: flagellar basal-body rod protein FlgF [Gemmataceae bacterium]|nr:flagellar basal-body rod protein FlgF [Gemmataceae bacterium]
MINGLYHSASALQAAQTNHEVISENIAHATTPGYRRQGLVFQVTGDDVPNAGPAAGGVRSDRQFMHFDTGPIQQTGNPYDLALAGNAFFAIQGPQGTIYTRSGAMKLGPQGQLQNHAGMPVLTNNGPVSIPEKTSRVEISADGTIFADGASLGKLRVVSFPNPEGIRRVGPTLYDNPNAQDAEPNSYRVEQGYREGSNVQVVQEMVTMMLGMRHYEASERAMRMLSESIGLNTKPKL